MQANIVKSTVCKRWIHKPYSGVRCILSVGVDGFRCKQCDGTIQEADLAGKHLVMDGEIYGSVLWETLLLDMVERILRQQLESEMDGEKFREIMPFLTPRAHAQVYASCVRIKQHLCK